MQPSHTCSECLEKLEDSCPDKRCVTDSENNPSPLVKGTCGHVFHFHCLVENLKTKYACPVKYVCPIDGAKWEFSRIGDRAKMSAPNSRGSGVCYKSHPELYRILNSYRVRRRAGHFDPASHTLLLDIQSHLAMMGHPYAPVVGRCIRRLPEGGMMINFEDWDWLFRFLDKLSVSSLDEDRFEKPPAWMGMVSD